MLGEDLVESMFSLDNLGELSPEDSSTRKRILTEIEHMAQQIEALAGRLGSMKGDAAEKTRKGYAAEKIKNQAAAVLASRECMQLAFSLGTVLEAILVHLPPRRHFAAVIALTQSGGARPDIAAIRMLQVPLPPLPVVLPSVTMHRDILLDWLAEVHTMFRCQPDTLYLTVTLIDRYLSKRSEAQSRPQLVSLIAMSIAHKFEGITPPSPSSLAVSGLDAPKLASHQQPKRQPKKSAYPTRPARPHGGKHQRRSGTLAQPGGRQRGKDRRAARN